MKHTPIADSRITVILLVLLPIKHLSLTFGLGTRIDLKYKPFKAGLVPAYIKYAPKYLTAVFTPYF
ncbi:MAG: hypothetical protein D8H95_14905 [Lachnospiraceae bacterium]|nr:MAG: hypothetical protein D8H95_14905 [Lachnospiraceae bacterium]